MSYLDDYHDEESRSKIPYDDIPISRTYEGGSSRRRRSFNFSGYRILIIMVAVLFVSNIALCIALVHHVKTGKIKSINYYYNEYAATEETQSTLAINNAKVMIFVLSEKSNKSVQVINEINLALKKGLKIIVVRITDINCNLSLEYYLSTAHWLNIDSKRVDEQLIELANRITLYTQSIKENNFSLLGLDFSPVKGPEGNIEYIIHLKTVETECDIDVRKVVDLSHENLASA